MTQYICKKHGELLIENVSRIGRRNGWRCKICLDKSRIKDWGDSPTLKCSTCEKEKIKSEYTKDERVSSSPRCKSCRSNYRKNYRKKNKEYVSNQLKYYRNGIPYEKKEKKVSDNWLMNNYSITFLQFKELETKQNNVCAICKKSERILDKKTGYFKRLAIDHCHKTGIVRGLLCANCNQGLGRFQDSIANLESAIEYLKNSMLIETSQSS